MTNSVFARYSEAVWNLKRKNKKEKIKIKYKFSNYNLTLLKETAGGTDTQAPVLIAQITGTHIEPAMAGVPAGADETGTRPGAGKPLGAFIIPNAQMLSRVLKILSF